MKKSMTVTEIQNGNLIIEIRFTAEGRKPNWPDDDHEQWDIEYAVSEQEVPSKGDTFMVAVGTHDYTDCTGSLLLRPDNGEGWPGNSDRNRCAYHGWRGTTDGFSVYAKGLRECLSVTITGKRSKKIRIVWGEDMEKGSL